jgi:hypothetical protein
MKTTPALAALFILTGCGAAPPCVSLSTTPLGIHLCSETDAATTIDAMSLDVVTRLSVLPGYAHAMDCVPEVYLKLWPDQFCESAAGQYELGRCYYGLTDKTLLQVVASNPDPWKWAYRHELVHFLQDCALGVHDSSHSGPEWSLIR